MSKPETIKIDEVEYVRKDSIQHKPDELDGLKYAVVRSRYQGVMAGYVKEVTGQTVVLKKARQLWQWDSAFVLVELATDGVRDADSCRFSCENSEDVVMLEACGIIYCTEKGGKSIRNVKDYKPS